MTNPIFLRTRYDYGSYKDYWRLVDLSGYQWIYVDEADVQDKNKLYIATTLNGEWNGGWPDAQARIIWHDL